MLHSSKGHDVLKAKTGLIPIQKPQSKLSDFSEASDNSESESEGGSERDND